MAFLEYSVILFLFSILMSILIVKYIHTHHNQKTVIPATWPLLVKLPQILVNARRLHDYITEILMQSGGTLMFKGYLFPNMTTLLTTEPLDIHHILSKNFSNYPKGDKFYKIFDVLGEGIVNSDGEIWRINRKVIMSMLKHPGFQRMMETIIWNKVETRLLPIFDSISQGDTEVDLQEIFHRFVFDTVCKLLLDNDPESLSLDFPYFPCLKAFIHAEEAIFLRHVTPPFLWKLQQLLRVGKEKKLMDAWQNVDQLIYKCLADKQKYYSTMSHEEEKFIFFTAIMRELKDQGESSLDPTKFLRDTLVNLMAAGKDTISSALSWFFYNLARNPTVEDKILEEIHTHLKVDPHKRWNLKELDEMVYLHGALCESLRLFPPIPFNHKSPLQPEILPSGHQVDQNTRIILSFYSMGRMKSIWGEDCMEFKPERWISEKGGIKHEPSYKFTTFNAGPKTCLGKNIALSQLKMVSTKIIYHYHIELVEGHPVLPADSIVLQIKHGVKVRLKRRNELN